jgi:hypothetical protein
MRLTQREQHLRCIAGSAPPGAGSDPSGGPGAQAPSGWWQPAGAGGEDAAGAAAALGAAERERLRALARAFGAGSVSKEEYVLGRTRILARRGARGARLDTLHLPAMQAALAEEAAALLARGALLGAAIHERSGAEGAGGFVRKRLFAVTAVRRAGAALFVRVESRSARAPAPRRAVPFERAAAFLAPASAHSRQPCAMVM